MTDDELKAIEARAADARTIASTMNALVRFRDALFNREHARAAKENGRGQIYLAIELTADGLNERFGYVGKDTHGEIRMIATAPVQVITTDVLVAILEILNKHIVAYQKQYAKL